MLSFSRVTDRAAWDREILALGGHPLQLWGWGAVKESGPWRAVRVRGTDAGRPLVLAQVLIRKLPAPFGSLCYIPRGPVLADGADRDGAVSQLADWCKRELGGIGLTLEPDWPADTPLNIPGLRRTDNTVLYPHTLVLDTTLSEDQLLADMKQTTRYNVRKGLKGPLEYRAVASLEELRACLAVYHLTAQRADFHIHSDAYYELVFTQLGEHAPTFAAFDADGVPHAFVMLAAGSTTSFELYAGQDEVGQKARANYPLKWVAITQMKKRGITRYDMNGLLGEGITSFKTSFAKHTDELIGTLDIPFSARYSLWTRALPAARAVLRKVR